MNRIEKLINSKKEAYPWKRFKEISLEDIKALSILLEGIEPNSQQEYDLIEDFMFNNF